MSKPTGHVLVWCALVALLIVAVIPLSLERPIPLIVVESNSMAPQLVRGDLGIVTPLFRQREPAIGDVIVFQEADTDRWVAHRIVGGASETGYLTKGDNNNAMDQEKPGRGPVMRSQIAGSLLSVNQRPLRIPALGLLVLRAQELVDPSILSWAALIIGAVFVSMDVFRSGRSSRGDRPSRFATWAIWLPLVGLVALSFAQTMIASSQEGRITYDIMSSFSRSPSGPEQGMEYTVTNDGALPLIVVLYSDDTNLVFSEQHIWLPPGDTRTVDIGLDDQLLLRQQSSYHNEALFRAGAYLPLLPPSVLHMLIAWDLKGSALVTALVPALAFALVFLIITWERGNRPHEALVRRRAMGS